MPHDHERARSEQREQARGRLCRAWLIAFRRVDAEDADALATQPERVAVHDPERQRAMDGWRTRDVIRGIRRAVSQHEENDERETERRTHRTRIITPPARRV